MFSLPRSDLSEYPRLSSLQCCLSRGVMNRVNTNSGEGARALVPFWFWNGDMEDSQIVAQIKEMADKGVAGFSLHPRQGLTVPYLSTEWFRKVKLAVSTAEELGLRVWFNDEYPYPSGASGGEVFLDKPEYLARTLRHQTIQVEGPTTIHETLPWGRVVFAKAFPVVEGSVVWADGVDLTAHIGSHQKDVVYQDTGLSRYNHSRFFTGNPVKQLIWRSPKGSWRIHIFLECIVERFKYFGHFVDVLNPDAIEYFLTTTYERYYRHLGPEFFRKIEAVFVDEIGAGNALTRMGLPWSPRLPEYFEKRNGYDLVENLPALVTDVPKAEKIRYDYRDTILSAFVDSFDRPVRDWCARHGVKYAGEKPVLRTTQLEYMDIPGIDAGHLKVGAAVPLGTPDYRANPKVLSSAAHFFQKHEALCEAFHSIGWDMTIQDMKWIIDWLAVQGINLFVPHGFFYTTDGLTKHDAPPSSFFQNPYWEYYAQLSQYTNNLCSHLSGEYAQAKILVLDPITSLWTRTEGDGLTGKLVQDWQYLQEELLRRHWDFYIADPRLLVRARLEGTNLKLGDNAFDTLLVPPITNLEETAAEIIYQAVESGVNVVFMGLLPFEQIEPGAKFSSKLTQLFTEEPRQSCCSYLDAPDGGRWFHSGSASWYATRGSLKENNAFDVVEQYLSTVSRRFVSVLDAASRAEIRDVLTLTYRKGNREFCFMVNTSPREFTAQVRFSAPRLAVAEIDLLSNTPKPVKAIAHDENTFELTFARYESHLLELHPSGKHQDPTPALIQEIHTGDDDWRVEIESKNLCRLGHWHLNATQNESLAFADTAVDHSSWPVTTPKTGNNQIRDTKLPVSIVLDDPFGAVPEIRLPADLNLWYRTEFDVHCSCPIQLVREPNGLLGEWSIYVNGRVIPSEVWRTQNIYLPTNLVADITPWLRQGRNVIAVKVKMKEQYDGLVSPLYLAGDFAVLERNRLVPPLKRGKFNDLIGAGLPFYVGKVNYYRTMYFSADCQQLALDCADFDQVCELFVDGQSLGCRAWSPYRWSLPEAARGEHEVRLRVTTSLLGAFDGLRFDRGTHSLKEI